MPFVGIPVDKHGLRRRVGKLPKVPWQEVSGSQEENTGLLDSETCWMPLNPVAAESCEIRELQDSMYSMAIFFVKRGEKMRIYICFHVHKNVLEVNIN